MKLKKIITKERELVEIKSISPGSLLKKPKPPMAPGSSMSENFKCVDALQRYDVTMMKNERQQMLDRVSLLRLG